MPITTFEKTNLTAQHPSMVSTTIDFNQDGVQHGFLRLPYSHDNAAWGCIMTPITQICNGDGPTVLLTGGNHGDEYEGITSLLKLSHTLKADAVSGRIIIVPMMNYPAVQNATRTSPIDKGNMNRSFPGRYNGTVTEKMADYFNRVLIPMCDGALDIHSGGKTLDILPFAAAHRLVNKEQERACIEAARIFAAPYTMIMTELDPTTLYDTAVESHGKLFVTTELGGGGSSTPQTVAYAERGIHNFLCYVGVIKAEYQQAKTPTILLDMPDASCYLLSEHRGVALFYRNLGEQVKSGEPLAEIYSIERSGIPPQIYYAQRDGILAARHYPAMVNIGDTFAVVAEDCGEMEAAD